MNPTHRFSDRVENYVRYRPGYPVAVLDILRADAGLTPDAAVADVGSGTGISAELVLRNGNTVFGVEPNAAMRAAAEQLLAASPKFRSVAGTAEATTLPDASVDLVVAGQAFHWFDHATARAEFARVLRPGGRVALMWNTRRTDTPFLRGYDELLHRYGTDYGEVVHTNITPEAFAGFFAGGRYVRRVLPNEQVFDLESLTGRTLSSSYVPPPGHPNHAPLLAELGRLFAEQQAGGGVRFLYDTEVYVGTVDK
jgi:SAM-dependent methyltransferase